MWTARSRAAISRTWTASRRSPSRWALAFTRCAGATARTTAPQSAPMPPSSAWWRCLACRGPTTFAPTARRAPSARPARVSAPTARPTPTRLASATPSVSPVRPTATRSRALVPVRSANRAPTTIARRSTPSVRMASACSTMSGIRRSSVTRPVHTCQLRSRCPVQPAIRVYIDHPMSWMIDALPVRWDRFLKMALHVRSVSPASSRWRCWTLPSSRRYLHT
mmetsp:Transcript_15988/g.41028  ORF Transcript_15988/g.41028 Transcript_15988/m.41028 type:complete len:222 (+) Transcript_15988:121-786(+)